MTPTAAKRARERAVRLEKNAQWLREEAERFENERKTNASANANEMANKKQQKKLTRSQQFGRPLTNAVYSQPALANDDEHMHTVSTKRAHPMKRDESTDSDLFDRLIVGQKLPGKLFCLFVFCCCTVIAGNLYTHFVVTAKTDDDYRVRCTLGDCDASFTIKKSTRKWRRGEKN
jgi:hypothetical protein